MKVVYKFVCKLDAGSFRINLVNCHFAKSENEWLGFLLQNWPSEPKTAPILKSIPAKQST